MGILINIYELYRINSFKIFRDIYNCEDIRDLKAWVLNLTAIQPTEHAEIHLTHAPKHA